MTHITRIQKGNSELSSTGHQPTPNQSPAPHRNARDTRGSAHHTISTHGESKCDDNIGAPTRSDPVLQGPLVKDVGRESGQCRVHAVLDLQPDGPNPQHHQSFKQRLRQAGPGSLLAHDHWAKLAVVADQDQLRQWNNRVPCSCQWRWPRHRLPLQ